MRCFEASACSLCPTINSALSPIYLQLHLQAAKLCQHLPGPVMHPWSPRAFVRVPAGSEGRKPASMRMRRASGTSCNYLLTWHINTQISRMERCELQAVALEAVHFRTYPGSLHDSIWRNRTVERLWTPLPMLKGTRHLAFHSDFAFT